MQTYTFHVHGMHCKSCVAITENVLEDLPAVSRVKASIRHLNVEVTGDFGDQKPEQVAQDLSAVLKPHGYTLSLEKETRSVQWSDFNLAIPIAAGFIAVFIILQKLGLVNLVTTSRPSYGAAFIIGLIASVSTCMAVVGGLVLSLAANYAKSGDKVRPQVLFHLSRLASFLILGGLIGALGAAFQLNQTVIFALSLAVAIVLLILGLNLLNIFPWAKKLQPTLPGSIGKRVTGLKNINHTLTPLVAGAATFFLPCGFTQSMQIYTLTTGSFLTGGLIMFTFALGTLPVLALLSFSSLGLHQSRHSGVFFKAAGLVVIFFGLFNLINALVAAAIIPPLFNF
ncbi:MAG: Heavy metal transport/detoxification protein [Parcubacteria group bacterium GW2011_GWA2_43_17]|nr:MAG: Heavy metal transport/detoxification protein [Parcubacteria group bacterium GW2011_GWA2_43_17]KKT92190.1 MAG: Heavy metal transport/detoxification protein [Parcubacteria group bacterium GW2011_GWF2_45_11]KKT98844.1 MAG: Heavy metal transport/detoxification protein [Parcubacteria group bacterium GW2011_GWC2_45_15]HAH04284.1 hypothetical protein [Candidatus Komeilibacteria bacterium]HBR13689.1 hypothetical protein [Candidatus Komeilibacteria bacterium]